MTAPEQTAHTGRGERGPRILDVSAGNRAIWFDKSHRNATYVDIRPEVGPTIVADVRALPAEIGDGFDLIVFDPPHKNNGASGKMAHNYGHWTAEQIRDIVTGSAREAHRVARPDALMAFKWNDHSRKLTSVLMWLSPWWEPLFGHGMEPQQRGRSTTSWVMLRRRDPAESFELTAEPARSPAPPFAGCRRDPSNPGPSTTVSTGEKDEQIRHTRNC